MIYENKAKSVDKLCMCLFVEMIALFACFLFRANLIVPINVLSLATHCHHHGSITV